MCGQTLLHTFLSLQVMECTIKLQRADKLIGGLGGERVRWQATVDQMATDLVNVVGDVVVAAGSIAYSGAKTAGRGQGREAMAGQR